MGCIYAYKVFFMHICKHINTIQNTSGVGILLHVCVDYSILNVLPIHCKHCPPIEMYVPALLTQQSSALLGPLREVPQPESMKHPPNWA